MSSAAAIGCCICQARPAPQRGLEITLRRHHAGRLVLRESDGLLPLCSRCLGLLTVDRRRPVWPALALAAAGLLLLRGDGLLALPLILAGLLGAAAALRQPRQSRVRRRLRAQVLRYSSVPLVGFQPADVSEILLERRLSVRYAEDGQIEVQAR